MNGATSQFRRRFAGRGAVKASSVWLALFVLNSALTFQNRWPTIDARWVPELSV